MRITDIVKELESFSPRIGKREANAKRYILRLLEGTEVKEQRFRNAVPKGRATLRADGEEIPSMPTSFVSGGFEGKPLISSIDVSARYYFNPNINFNPYSDDLSLATFYFAPSIAVRREHVEKILSAERVEARVRIKKERFASANLVVGNTENPKVLCFAHYDTVLHGAVDNSSGSAVLLHLIKTSPRVLRKCAFVFSGSEELSYDKPVYWGKGYRVFEEENRSLMQRVKKILVIDCVGFAPPVATKDFLLQAFPVKTLEKIRRKTYLIICDLRKIRMLWRVYHTARDTPELLREKYLMQAERLVLQAINGRLPA